MELYKEILSRMLREETVHVVFPDLKIDGEKIVQMGCYQALQKIGDIIRDETLEDEECFLKIEEIIKVLEDYGVECGLRHDFG
ncbi:MAG TPA: hypothetical protein IAB55_07300 [Candidatus Merdivicinus faecavium]|nr:hypothetical protein [Candidatus Merdivicinus faecavium]